ncbi:MAG TPA: hypothetical protein VMZ91_05375, partial [Candidatus Paceibacterota bacterium]|nr:hypothetical protein [Candidatus Paceibacterota bacterium]
MKKLSDEEKRDLTEWCKNAIVVGHTQKSVEEKFNSYPKTVKNFVNKTFKQMLKRKKKMKGGLDKK